jgi:hypothetical protein
MKKTIAAVVLAMSTTMGYAETINLVCEFWWTTYLFESEGTSGKTSGADHLQLTGVSADQSEFNFTTTITDFPKKIEEVWKINRYTGVGYKSLKLEDETHLIHHANCKAADRKF